MKYDDNKKKLMILLGKILIGMWIGKIFYGFMEIHTSPIPIMILFAGFPFGWQMTSRIFNSMTACMTVVAFGWIAWAFLFAVRFSVSMGAGWFLMPWEVYQYLKEAQQERKWPYDGTLNHFFK